MHNTKYLLKHVNLSSAVQVSRSNDTPNSATKPSRQCQNFMAVLSNVDRVLVLSR